MHALMTERVEHFVLVALVRVISSLLFVQL
jgi:hypothetical protein